MPSHISRLPPKKQTIHTFAHFFLARMPSHISRLPPKKQTIHTSPVRSAISVFSVTFSFLALRKPDGFGVLALAAFLFGVEDDGMVSNVKSVFLAPTWRSRSSRSTLSFSSLENVAESLFGCNQVIPALTSVRGAISNVVGSSV